MQTELVGKLAALNKFEKNFSYFFDECERGFSNEIIVNTYCRFFSPGKRIISYKSYVKELYFTWLGVVEVCISKSDYSVDRFRVAPEDSKDDKED